MWDDDFEWDDAKAASNWLDHGISFDMAREAFKDAFAVERVDNRHDDNEERVAMLGMVEDRLLFCFLHDAKGTNSHHLSPEGGPS